MTTAEHRAALRDLWRQFVAHDFRDYSPLYATIGSAVAEDDELLDLVAAAPPAAHLPLSLLASVHYLLLAEPDLPLARVYAGDRPRSEAPALFRALCRERRPEIEDLLATRRIQTNEVGRSAVLAVGLAAAAAAVGPIGTLVDAGTSAGLNLRFDRYRLDYGDLGVRGDTASSVHVPCTVTGLHAIPHLPAPGRRIGVDRSPVDVTDADQARWLLACVWPDTGRLERTAAAIEAARADPPVLRTGDLANPLDTALGDDSGSDAVVVMSSQAVAYLDGPARAAFRTNLTEESRRRPVAWVGFEPVGVAVTPAGPAPLDVGTTPTLLTLWVPGELEQLLGWSHPHGGRLHWCAPPSRS